MSFQMKLVTKYPEGLLSSCFNGNKTNKGQPQRLWSGSERCCLKSVCLSFFHFLFSSLFISFDCDAFVTQLSTGECLDSYSHSGEGYPRRPYENLIFACLPACLPASYFRDITFTLHRSTRIFKTPTQKENR